MQIRVSELWETGDESYVPKGKPLKTAGAYLLLFVHRAEAAVLMGKPDPGVPACLTLAKQTLLGKSDARQSTPWD